MSSYVKWNAPGVEVEQPGEKQKIQEVSDQFNRLQMLNFAEHHHCFRGTHLKTQGCVKGRLVVKEGLLAHLRQGMFKEPSAPPLCESAV